MWRTCISVWCFVLPVVAAAQQAKPLTLQGRIVDAKAQPVSGAEVAAYEQFYNYATGENYAKLLDEIKRTDADGRFVVGANIHVRRRVFVVARKEGLALGWDVLDFNTDDEAVANFNIILEPPCTLAGTVFDEQGSPVAGAKVRALPKTSYLERLRQRPILAPEQWLTTETDNKGRFSFKNFAADVRSDFWVDAPGRASVHKCTTNYLSACGFEAGRADVRLVLPQEVPVRGRVVNGDTGNPVPGANMVIRPHPDSIGANINPYCPKQTISEEDGRFHFDGIPGAKHFIEVSVRQNETLRLVSKTIKFSVRAEEPVKDVVVELVKGGEIKMVAREATTQEPICDVAVYFWQTTEDDKSGFYKWALTGTDGTLRISAPPGECSYSAQCDGYSPSRVNDQVLVTKGQTSRVDILFDRKRPVSEAVTSAVRRRLIYAGKVTDTDGQAIPAARVALWIAKPDALWPFGPEVLADAHGRYQVKAVPPEDDQFDCRAFVNAAGYGSAQFRPISVKSKQGTTVEMERVSLKPANLSISGIVVYADGKPAAGLPVFLHGSDQPDQTTATDASGRFVFDRICEGRLRLQASFDSHPGGSGVLRAHGGDQNVKIVLGEEGVHEGHASLLGRQLPDLNDLSIKLPADRIKAKMILVCFFDMQQRPSRNCLRQLSKRAQEFQAQDVIVLAAQASKVKEKELNEWVRENNVPFPIGMVQGDEESIRFAWGVRSLPWLILTDRQRIVTTGGFALNELDEKVKEIADEKR